MNRAAEATKRYFEAKSLKYTELRDTTLKVVFGGENKDSLEVLLIFDEDNSSVAVRSFELCTVPENKKANMYKLCSMLNDEYRWVKFYLDEDDNTIEAAMDAVIQLETCGEECFELVLRVCRIVDDVYPRFMKGLWG